jgi:hypothetical protein
MNANVVRFEEEVSLLRLDVKRNCLLAVMGSGRINWMTLEPAARVVSSIDTGLQVVDVVFHPLRDEVLIIGRAYDQETQILDDRLTLMRSVINSREISGQVAFDSMYPPYSKAMLLSHPRNLLIGAEESIWAVDLNTDSTTVVADSEDNGYVQHCALALSGHPLITSNSRARCYTL